MECFIHDWSHRITDLYLNDKFEDAIELVIKQWNKKIPSIPCKTKNAKETTKRITIINELFPTLQTSPFMSSTLLKSYTEAIAFAPNDSPELSRAYANRSAVLCETHMYEDSLEDINKALTENCSDHLKAKLYARKGKNLSALGAERLAIVDAIAEARRWMVITNVDEKIMETRLKGLIKIRSYPKPFEKTDHNLLMSDITDTNEILVGASNAIELKYSEKFGRHIVATRDIKVGETLMKHKAYSLIFPLKTYTHCWNCIKRTWSSIPCTHCTNVVFCDENCRNEAWNNFHDVECSIMDYVVTGEPVISELMGLRLTIKALKEAGSIESLKEKFKLLDSIKDPLKQGFTQDILDNNTYAGIYTLNSNFYEKSNIEARARNLVMCTFIIAIWATVSDIFGKKIERMDELIDNDTAMFMGRLIMKNIRICDQNAQEIILCDNRELIHGAKMLSCLTSYINHSCDCNVSYVHCGDTMAVNSIQTIKKGEQIFLTYANHYQIATTADRQEFLKERYNFKCDCHACQENWCNKTRAASFMDQPLDPEIISRLKKTYIENIRKLEENAANRRNIICDSSPIPILIDLLNNLHNYATYPCREICVHKGELRLKYIDCSDN